MLPRISKGPNARPPGQANPVAVVLGFVAAAGVLAALFYFLGVSTRPAWPGQRAPLAVALGSGLGPVSTPLAATAQAHPLAECVDLLVPFHEDDSLMFLDNGAFESMKKQLIGIRRIFILSKSKDKYAHLMDNRTEWYPESRVPFTKADFKGNHPRPLGWMYQQALKMWVVLNSDEMCNQVMVMDSDVAWLRPFDVRTVVKGAPGQPDTIRYKYPLSSRDSGAYEGDIDFGEYHHAVSCLIGLPKALKDSHTAINHWSLFQRDVLRALEANLQVRGYKNLFEAIRACMFDSNGSMSEYEAYFSYIWHLYRSRIDPVHLPYLLRNPKLCNLNDPKIMKTFEGTHIFYFACHDSLLSWDQNSNLYTNCKQKGAKCP